MTTEKTTQTLRRTARNLALAAPAIALIGSATPAWTQGERPASAPSVSIVTKQGADVANGFARALAAWQLEALSGEASTEALGDLRLQIQRAVKEAPADTALADVLVDAEAAWITRIAAAGAPSEREAALASLAAAVSLAEGEGEADPLTAARARAAVRPGVAPMLAARAEAKAASAPASPAQTDVALKTAIETSLEAGDRAFVTGLGPRAVEPLRQLALATTGAPAPQGAVSPLNALVLIDAAAGLDVAADLVARDDLLVKREVVAALNPTIALRSDAAWSGRPGEPRTLRDPRWLDMIRGLAKEPAVSVESLRPSLEILLGRAALPADLHGVAVAAGARAMNEALVFHPANRAYFERALGSDDPGLVQAAAGYFAKQRDPSPIYPLVDSADRGLRTVAEQTLGARTVLVYEPGSDRATQVRVAPEIDAAYVDAFRRSLRRDPSDAWARLIGAALGAVVEDPRQTLPVDLVLELAAVGRTVAPPYGMRVLEYVALCEGEAETERAVAFVRDSIAAGVADLDFFRAVLDRSGEDDVERSTYWAVREMIDAETEHDPVLDRARIQSSLARLQSDPDDLDRVFGFVREVANDPDPLRSGNLGGTIAHLGLVYALEKHAPSRLESAVVEMSSWPRFTELCGNRGRAGFENFEWQSDRAVLEAVLTAETTTPENRYWALRELQRANGPVSDPAALERACVEVIAASRELGFDLDEVERLGGSPSKVVDAVLARGGVPAETLAAIEPGPIEPEVARRALEAVAADAIAGIARPVLIEDAADSLYASGAPDRTEVLAPYVERNRYVAWRVMLAFRQAPAADALPLVEAGYEGRSWDGEKAHEVIGAIGGLMTDGSARLLLSLGRRSDLDAETRRVAMEQFEAMLQWREAAARWERSSGAVARRDEAIAKLVALLDGDSATTAQRVQAVRGLGLLGAAEELPRLIALLDDDELRAAAQEAIDALHARDAGDGE